MYAQHLLDTQELYEVVINNLSDGIYMVDRDHNVLVWNEAAEKITGYTQDEMRGCHEGIDLLDHIDRTGTPLTGHGCPVLATIEDGRKRTHEMYLKHKRGYRIPVVVKTVPITANNEITSAMVVFSDNSVPVQQTDLASSLKQLNITDQLTGLSNRHHIEKVLQSRLEGLRQTAAKFSVLYINLDDFSRCNDRHGYEAGNRVLVGLANRFRSMLRDTDFIGRWAGEEFVGIFNARDMTHLKIIAAKIRELIEQTKITEGTLTIGVTASIGATMAAAGDTMEDLVERAASLMHVSKISGKNCATIG